MAWELQPPRQRRARSCSCPPIVADWLPEIVERLSCCMDAAERPDLLRHPQHARLGLEEGLADAGGSASPIIAPGSLSIPLILTRNPFRAAPPRDIMVPLVLSSSAASATPVLACRARGGLRRGGRRACFHVRAAAAAGGSSGSTPAAVGPTIVTDEAVPEGHAGLHGFLYGEGGAEEAHGTGRGYTFREVGAAPPALPRDNAHRASWAAPLVLALPSGTPSGPAAPAGLCPSPAARASACKSAACDVRPHALPAQGEDDGASLLPVATYLAAREGERPVGVYALYDSRRNLQYVGYSRNVVLSVRVRAGKGARAKACAGRALHRARPRVQHAAVRRGGRAARCAVRAHSRSVRRTCRRRRRAAPVPAAPASHRPRATPRASAAQR